MKDHPEIIKEFVKIVQRYPEVYDTTVDSYRMRGQQNKAWLRIRNCVKHELNEDCTPDELKLKWKGIRSSFSRYLSKLQNSLPCRKYYLYDTLSFLVPFVNPKIIPQTSSNTEFAPDNETSADWLEYEEVDIKPDMDQKGDTSGNTDSINPLIEAENRKPSSLDDLEVVAYTSIPAKRKWTAKDDEDSIPAEENSDLMQFFRSIVPDLKDFTLKEKRQFKMGVLGLIDVIEEQRQKGKTCNNVNL